MKVLAKPAITIGAVVMAWICVSQTAIAQKSAVQPASAAELARTTARGKLLAEYDDAAASGTDAVLGAYPQERNNPHFAYFIANKRAQGWVVDFGTPSASGDKFTIAFEATQSANGKYKAAKFSPAKLASGDLAIQGRAVRTVTSQFPKSDRPYNYAIVPAPNQQWFVYVYPGQTEARVYPLGGDYRYLVSNDGSKILETRRMHKNILDIKPDPKGRIPLSGYHNHVLSDVPEDSDVAHVLMRKPRVPEIIDTPRFVYEIGTTGGITYKGTIGDLKKR